MCDTAFLHLAPQDVAGGRVANVNVAQVDVDLGGVYL
jgi:hypothetical protein